jgi:thiamine biosynthesis lipoprotein
LLFCLSCAPTKPYQEENGGIFNTYYTVKYESSVLLTDKIKEALEDFNMSLNPFNPNSIISKVNRNEEVALDDKFSIVFNKAMEVSEKSGGAFDVTVAPLINLWGFGFEKSDSITRQTIDSIKTFVGYKKIRIENRKIIKDDPRIMLNFSAIAKGYACDVIGELLEREGVKNYLVCIGGEIASKGKNPKGQCWRSGINKPYDDNTGIVNELEELAVMLCGKKGLATSGNYRNFYIRDGKKYSHTIDPHTGYPSEQSILSASIVAPDCMTADAYATAFMVMGSEAACEMAKNIPEIEYYLITDDDSDPNKIKHIYSAGMKPLLLKLSPYH